MRPNEPSPEAGAETYERCRPLLFSIAYRMLGSVSDSEDVLQEAYLGRRRASAKSLGQRGDPLPKVLPLGVGEPPVHRPTALRGGAREKHVEKHVGSWLPEPLPTADGVVPKPVDALPLDETPSMAFLVLPEGLSPVERAVFVLLGS